VTVEDDVFIGPGVLLSNDKYPPTSVSRGAIIRKDAIIGIGCILGPEIEVGAGSVVGAGTLIVKDVPAGKVLITKHTYQILYDREEYDSKQRDWIQR